MRIWTPCSATTRAMCTIVVSCSRQRLSEAGLMFISLQHDGGRTAFVVLLDSPYPNLLRVVFVCHYGGALVFFGWAVNTP